MNKPESKTNLLPCPFCGSEAKIIWDKLYDPLNCGGGRTPERDEFYVECAGCHVVPNGWGNTGWDSEDDAIAAWNRRASNHCEPETINSENETETIRKMADDSYKAHLYRGGCRGQMIAPQDDYIFHVIQATKRLVSQNPLPCKPETAPPDQIGLGKLAAFGKSVWDWIKANPDFCGDEFALTLMPMAEKAGLCKYETYDPEKHGEFPDLVPGEDELYYWGKL